MMDTNYNKSDFFNFSNDDRTVYDRYIPENDMVDDSIIYYNCYRCWNPFNNSNMSSNNKNCLNFLFRFIILFLIISCVSIILALVYKTNYS